MRTPAQPHYPVMGVAAPETVAQTIFGTARGTSNIQDPMLGSEELSEEDESSLQITLLALICIFLLVACCIALVVFYASSNTDVPTENATTVARPPKRPDTVHVNGKSTTRGQDKESSDDYVETTSTQDVTSAQDVTSPRDVTVPTKQRGSCQSADCLNVAHFYGRFVGHGAAPCDNFYSYVCNGSDINVIADIRARMIAGIGKEFSKVTVPVAKQSATQKARAFFSSCLLRSVQTGDSIQVLHSFFRKIGISFTDPAADPLRATVQLLLRHGISVFFSLEIFNGALHAGKYLLVLKESTSFVAWREEKGRLRDSEYRTYVSDVLTNSRVAATQDVSSTAKRIRGAETKIFDVRNQNNNNRIMTGPLRLFIQVPTLNTHWEDLLSKYSDGVLGKPHSVGYQEKMFQFVNVVFGRHDLVPQADLNVYIAWDVTRQLSDAALLRGIAINEKTDCNRKLLSMFKHASVWPYFESVQTSAKQVAVTAMVNQVKDKIAGNVRKSAWLDEATKSSLLSRLSALRFQVGFPGAVNSTDKLEAFYAAYPDVDDRFLQAFLDASSAGAKGFLTLLNTTPADVSLLDFNYLELSPFYERNGVVYIPPAAMLSPEYNYGAPSAVNYGSLGGAIGHEIMHAFDPTNRGSLQWSAESNAGYDERSACVDDSIKTVPITKRTLKDEYMADIMASGAVYKAYKADSTAMHDTILSLEQFSSDQLFFMGKCLLYCAPAGTAQSGSHPPYPHRCNVPAANSPQFAAAFSCPKGSPMNPERKCTFW